MGKIGFIAKKFKNSYAIKPMELNFQYYLDIKTRDIIKNDSHSACS